MEKTPNIGRASDEENPDKPDRERIVFDASEVDSETLFRELKAILPFDPNQKRKRDS